MAGESRENSFEKALAGHVRANTPAALSGAKNACADAETLAAYHERTLPPGELASWKTHIAGCSQCQEVLSHLVQTDAIPVDVGQEIPSAATLAPSQTTPVLQIPAPRKAKRWLWAAPAGAIAAGLLVWVAVNQKPKPIQMAKNQRVVLEPNVSLPEASRDARQDLRSEYDDLSKSAPVQTKPGQHARGSESPKDLRVAEQPAPGPTKPPAEGGRALPSRRALNQLQAEGRTFAPQPKTAPIPSGNSVSGSEAKKLDEQPVLAATAAPQAPAPEERPRSVTQTVEVMSEAPQVPASQPADQSAGKAKAAQSGVAGGALEKQKEGVQQTEGMSRFKQEPEPPAAAMMRLARSKSPIMIFAPGEKVQWQVGSAGTIERSDNSGMNWTPQTSGVVADLLAGSAPSDQVCWAVGRLGTILRTTDGGAHWIKLQAPVEEDFVSVVAKDAQQAIISTGREIYRTTDAGVTWKK